MLFLKFLNIYKRALETVQCKKFQTAVLFTKVNSSVIFRGTTSPTNIFAEHFLVSPKKKLFSFFSDKSCIFIVFLVFIFVVFLFQHKPPTLSNHSLPPQKKIIPKNTQKRHWKTLEMEFCNFRKIWLQHGRTENLLKAGCFQYLD